MRVTEYAQVGGDNPFVLLVVCAGILLGAGCTAAEQSTDTQSPASSADQATAQRSVAADQGERYPLIPWPRQLEPQDGTFTLDKETRILVSEPENQDARSPAERLATLVRDATVFPMRVAPMTEAGGPFFEQPDNTIAFVLTEGEASTGNEASRLNNTPDEGEEDGRYELKVTPRAVVVRAPTTKGLFYGMQTLRQLLPSQIERGLGYDDERIEWVLPAVQIEDAPRFPYRGMHLDVGRHVFPVSFIKKYIDLLALHKLDTFHWHLTEDQGWRIEIEQYPRLTSVGACRDSSMVGHYEAETYDGSEYCGYYTQEEVREVVQYAKERHVTVIPEIEMPGHARAALTAYPEMGCTSVTDSSYTVATRWGVHEQIYCPKEKTFTFLRNVLTEVMELFPSKHLHIGADEVPKEHWEESKVAQAVIEREGLAGEKELQSYFIRRIGDFLNKHGRELIGWDEILEGGLPRRATVMSWRGTDGGIEAAHQGQNAIMTPTDALYFDYYQADPANEPLAIGGMTTLRDVYAYDPVPDSLGTKSVRHIIGAQANVWTEYINTLEKVEYMAYPRALALSEIVWTPESDRRWGHFQARLPAHLRRLDALDVDYRAPDFIRSGDVVED